MDLADPLADVEIDAFWSRREVRADEGRAVSRLRRAEQSARLVLCASGADLPANKKTFPKERLSIFSGPRILELEIKRLKMGKTHRPTKFQRVDLETLRDRH